MENRCLKVIEVKSAARKNLVCSLLSAVVQQYEPIAAGMDSLLPQLPASFGAEQYAEWRLAMATIREKFNAGWIVVNAIPADCYAASELSAETARIQDSVWQNVYQYIQEFHESVCTFAELRVKARAGTLAQTEYHAIRKSINKLDDSEYDWGVKVSIALPWVESIFNTNRDALNKLFSRMRKSLSVASAAMWDAVVEQLVVAYEEHTPEWTVLAKLCGTTEQYTHAMPFNFHALPTSGEAIAAIGELKGRLAANQGLYANAKAVAMSSSFHNKSFATAWEYLRLLRLHGSELIASMLSRGREPVQDDYETWLNEVVPKYTSLVKSMQEWATWHNNISTAHRPDDETKPKTNTGPTWLNMVHMSNSMEGFVKNVRVHMEKIFMDQCIMTRNLAQEKYQLCDKAGDFAKLLVEKPSGAKILELFKQNKDVIYNCLAFYM